MSQVILFDATTARYASPPSHSDEVDLYDKLAYKIEGAEHSPQAQKFIWDAKTGKRVFNKRYTGWDGMKRLYNRRDHSFPIGLIHRALEITPDAILRPLLPALDRKPFGEFAQELKYTPFRHQIVAFEELTRRGHAMVELPTASGKSLLIAMLAMSMRHGIGLITVPSVQLLRQTRDDIMELTQGKLQLGIYGDGECDLKGITIATIQSLYSGSQSRPEIAAWLNEVQWWVVDEAHGAAADSYSEVSSCLPKAMVRYGVTATWRREDNAELILEGTIGPLVYRETPDQLIREGVLVEPEVEVHYFDPGEQEYASAKPQFKTVYKQCISLHEGRNLYIVDQVRRAIQDDMAPVLVLVQELDHGKELAKRFAEADLPTEFIKGEDNADKRDKAVSKLLTGKYPVLVASGIFDTGVNIPPIRTLINAAAGMSPTLTIQRAGRALRQSKSTGKTRARIVDFYDDEKQYLRRHAKNRRSTYCETYPGRVVEFSPDDDGL